MTELNSKLIATTGEHNITVPRYVPASRWGDYFNWPPQGGLRHIIFNAESNGFKPAIKRVGRNVIIDTQKFWQIVDESE